MTDSEREHWLRRLRFPPHLEREFCTDLFRKSIRQWRLFVWLGMLLTIAGALADWGEHFTPGMLLWRFAVNVPLSILCLVCSYRPWFPRWWQAFSAALLFSLDVVYFVAADARLRAMPDLSDAARQNTFLVGVCAAIVATFTMSRLRFLWATGVSYAAIAVAAWLLARDAGSHLPELIRDSQNVLLVVLFAMLGGNYTLERLMRNEFLSRWLLEREQARSDELLRNVLPDAVAERLKEDPGAKVADDYEEATVLFADIVDFTPLAARLPAAVLVELLNEVFTAFDRLADVHGLEKIKTIGDAYMVVGGVPTPRLDHANAVAEMALAMRDLIGCFDRLDNGRPLQLRIGIHTGPVVAGVIGTRKFTYDLWGDTVNTASRMESHGSPGFIQVTEAAYERLRDAYAFSPPREVEIKGRGRGTTYFLLGRKSPAPALPDPLALSSGSLAPATRAVPPKG